MQNKCSLPSINFLFMRILTFRYCLFYYPDRNAGIQYLLFNDTLLLKNEFKAIQVRNGDNTPITTTSKDSNGEYSDNMMPLFYGGYYLLISAPLTLFQFPMILSVTRKNVTLGASFCQYNIRLISNVTCH